MRLNTKIKMVHLPEMEDEDDLPELIKVQENKFKIELPFDMPEGYELNEDENYVIKRNELFFSNRGYPQHASTFSEHSIGYILNNFGKYYFIKKIEKPKTKEELRLIARQKAKNFVDTHISNPSKGTYERFEKAFFLNNGTGL